MANGKKKKKLTEDPPHSFAEPLFAGSAHDLLRRRVLGGRTAGPDAASPGHVLGGYGAGRPVKRAVGPVDRAPDGDVTASRSDDEKAEIRSALSGSSLLEEGFHWHGLRRASAAPEDATAPGVEPAGSPATARDKLLRLWSVASQADRPAATVRVPEASDVGARGEEAELAVWPDAPTPGGQTSAPISATSRVEQLELMRAVVTGVEHMTRSIDELRASIDALGDWAVKLAAELGERSFGHLLIDVGLVERGVEAAEQRERTAVASTTEQVEVVHGDDAASHDGSPPH